MRFVSKRHYDVNKNTSTNYASLKDIESFHDKLFVENFKEFIKQKPLQNFGQDKGYYYMDYEFCARQTYSFLNYLE